MGAAGRSGAQRTGEQGVDVVVGAVAPAAAALGLGLQQLLLLAVVRDHLRLARRGEARTRRRATHGATRTAKREETSEPMKGGRREGRREGRDGGGK